MLFKNHPGYPRHRPNRGRDQLERVLDVLLEGGGSGPSAGWTGGGG